MVHLQGEQWEHATEDVSHEAICRHGGSGVCRPVCIDKITSRADEDGEVPPREGDSGDDGAGPGDIASSRPREPEESDGETERAEHGGDETVFRSDDTVCTGCFGEADLGLVEEAVAE